MTRRVWVVVAAAGAVLALAAQNVDFSGIITKGERPRIAIPDLRGDAQAQGFMATLNQTLWSDVDAGGIFRMVPKTMYPTTIPQQPSDFRQPPPVVAPPRGKKGELVQPPSGGGLWVSDWSMPPSQANYLAFGYSYVQNGLFVLRAWLFDGRPPGSMSECSTLAAG